MPLIPAAIKLGLTAAGVMFAGGFFVDKTGEGINDASNGIVKIAVAGGVAYIILKKVKVL